MKINAYKCDNCQTITEAREVIGIKATADLFDKTKSFPFEYKDLEACEVHACQECCRLHIEVAAENSANKGKNREAWEIARAELSYLFRHKLVNNRYLSSVKQRTQERQQKIF